MTIDELLALIMHRRADPTPDTVRLALRHRGLVRCFNKDDLPVLDLVQAQEEPVVKFQLTPRGKVQAKQLVNSLVTERFGCQTETI
jgi:hypothetical protein